MKKRIKIAFFVIMLTLPLELDAAIKDHVRDIELLNGFMQNGVAKTNEFRKLIEKIDGRIKDMHSIMEKTENTIPIRERQKESTLFSYYENGILIHTSNKGKGIEIDQNESLLIKKNGFAYSLKDNYYYSSFIVKNKYKDDGEDKKNNKDKLTKLRWLSINDYEYWENDNYQYGFKSKDKNKKTLYKFYAEIKDNKSFYKVSKGNHFKLYFAKTDQQLMKYYIFPNNRAIKIYKSGNFIYYINNKKKIGYFLNKKNELILLNSLADIIYHSNINYRKKKKYIQHLLIDFPEHNYSKYLKLIIQNKIPLRSNAKIMASLINKQRKSYNLPYIELDSILNKICKKHLDYILAYEPEDLHSQDEAREGYFGKTSFQRRKSMGYPNQVKELIIGGYDPIRVFLKAISYEEWQRLFLSPLAVHFGHHNMQFKKGSLNVVLIGIKEDILGTAPQDNIEEKIKRKVAENNLSTEWLDELFWK